MDAAAALDRRASPLTITRQGAGSYVSGIWTPGADGTITIQAVIQPLSGKERQLMPEGIRDSGKWRVWSRNEIMNGDRLTINGTVCVIIAVEVWPSHYRAVAGDADGSS